jgi:hypothetical protein
LRIRANSLSAWREVGQGSDGANSALRNLEGARNSHPAAGLRRLSADIPALKFDLAAIWDQHARDQSQQRRLAGAVWPKYSDRFTLLNIKIQIPGNRDRAERFGNLAKRQYDRHGGRDFPEPAGTRWSWPPRRPFDLVRDGFELTVSRDARIGGIVGYLYVVFKGFALDPLPANKRRGRNVLDRAVLP